MKIMKITTTTQAKKDGSIIDEILSIPSEIVNVNGGGRNYNLVDIFGSYHKFFHPYSHKTIPLFIKILDNGYCYNYDEIVFTKNKEIVIDHTSLRNHPMIPPATNNKIKKIYYKLKYAKSYIKFYLQTFRARKINGSCLCLSRNGLEKNYGHFLIECMANYHLVKEKIADIDFIIVDHSLKFQQEIIELLGIPKEKLISIDDRYLLQAKKLIVPTILADWEYIDLRHHLHYGSLGISSKLTSFYRNNPNICNFDKKQTLKLFISRKNASFRFIENNDNVENLFREFGYKIIDDKSIPLKELIALCNQSKVIAGIHGAGLTNILFAPKKSHLFVLETQYFHDNYFVTLANSLDINYHYIVGETKDTSMHPRLENAYFDEAKLKEALNILEEKIK